MNALLALALALALVLVACGGAPDHDEPVTCVQAAPGLCNNAGCVAYKTCDGVPDFGEAVVCTLTGDSGNATYPLAYTCRWSS